MNNDTYVKKYIRKDGTEVKNHFRTEANDIESDNYTTQGNVNPYTDEKGTKKDSSNNEETPKSSES